MSTSRVRSLSVGPLRAFEALSRSLNFRVAAEELHLTQPAISRQIKSLESEVGAVLVERDTRRVQLTAAGVTLLQSLEPWLGRLDSAVRQIRQTEGRQVATLSTFASLASLWLVPRLERLQQFHPMDLRVLSRDQIVAPETAGAGAIDAVVRYCRPEDAPEGALHLFDELVAPVASPALLARCRKAGRPLRRPGDLAQHTLIEDMDLLPSAPYRSWFGWLQQIGVDLQPRHWLYFTLAHQQVQAAIAGQGVALGRLPLIMDSLNKGELVEPFAAQPESRRGSLYAYWLIPAPPAGESHAGRLLREWILAEAALTRQAMEAHLAGRSRAGRPG